MIVWTKVGQKKNQTLTITANVEVKNILEGDGFGDRHLVVRHLLLMITMGTAIAMDTKMAFMGDRKNPMMMTISRDISVGKMMTNIIMAIAMMIVVGRIPCSRAKKLGQSREDIFLALLLQ